MSSVISLKFSNTFIDSSGLRSHENVLVTKNKLQLQILTTEHYHEFSAEIN